MTTHAEEYGKIVRTNCADMIWEVSKTPDGTPKSISEQLAVGILTAQSNLAIAASIAELADVLRES